MSDTARIFATAQSQADRLATAVSGWTTAVRALADGRPSRQPVLPLRDVAREFLGPTTFVERLPSAFGSVEVLAQRQSLAAHLQGVAARVYAADAELQRCLSGLAFETAAARVLLEAGDSVDITADGVLVATSLCNLLHLGALWQKSGQELAPEVKRLAAHVTTPLRLADERSAQGLRPGDLWFADLAARTARQLYRGLVTDPKRPAHAATAAWLGPLVLLLIARSPLTKLLEAQELGADLITRVRFDHWPGLSLLLTADDAASLRRVLLSELTRQVAAERRDYAEVALLRFLSSLVRTPESLQTRAAWFAAHLLWELLEVDRDVLARMLKREKVAAALLEAVRFIDEQRMSAPSDESAGKLLQDAYAGLRTFPQFTSLVSLTRTAGLAGPAPVNVALA